MKQNNLKLTHFRKVSENYNTSKWVCNIGWCSLPIFLNEGNKYNKGDVLMIIDNQKNNDVSEIELTIHGINTLRCLGYLVIYTNSYANTTEDGCPDTNGYGFEAAVSKDGLVIDVGIHAKIPEGGYVLSGNEKSETLIRQHIKIGSNVSYNIQTKKVKVTNSEININITTVELKLEAIKVKIDDAKVNLYDVDISNAQLNYDKAKALHNEMVNLKIKYEISENPLFEMRVINQKRFEVSDLLSEATYYLMPSYAVEGRGIWHRPVEKNLDEMRILLDKLKEVGINILYVETIYDGYTIYPSEILEMHPKVKNGNYGEYGIDYLKALIAEGHKRGIEVHAWSHILRTRDYSKVVLDHPEWLIETLDGKTTVTYYGSFFDPSNPGVKEYLVSIIDEILTNYDLDGFQYDYIRYPAKFESPLDKEMISGFTEYAMDSFKLLHGLSGDVRLLINDPNISIKWDEFKRNAVTDVVKAMSDKIREYPDVDISIDVSPVPDMAKANYMQDWTVWVKNGWVDIICPMIYMGDTKSVIKYAEDIRNIIGNRVYQYTGIAPVYYGFSELINQQQIEVLQGVTLGTTMFETINLLGNKDYEYALKLSTNRKEAIAPHTETKTVIIGVFDEILDKVNRIYIPNQAMTKDQFCHITNDIHFIKAMNATNAKDITLIKEKVHSLNGMIPIYAEGAAIDRIQEDLTRLELILDIKISQDLIKRGIWNPEFVKERPIANNFD
jgi:uncharacterized lipoprotein YddW (UPF0748 family)